MTAENHGRLPYCNDFRHGCGREGVETAFIDEPFLCSGRYLEPKRKKKHPEYEADGPTLPYLAYPLVPWGIGYS